MYINSVLASRHSFFWGLPVLDSSYQVSQVQTSKIPAQRRGSPYKPSPKTHPHKQHQSFDLEREKTFTTLECYWINKQHSRIRLMPRCRWPNGPHFLCFWFGVSFLVVCFASSFLCLVITVITFILF